MNRLIITKGDGFVFIDLTEKAEELFNELEMYSWDGEAESLLESIYDLRKAIADGCRIVIEGGFLPKKKLKFTDADKALVDGFWYTKMADLPKEGV
jgi:hypothetical protein